MVVKREGVNCATVPCMVSDRVIQYFLYLSLHKHLLIVKVSMERSSNEVSATGVRSVCLE